MSSKAIFDELPEHEKTQHDGSNDDPSPLCSYTVPHLTANLSTPQKLETKSNSSERFSSEKNGAKGFGAPKRPSLHRILGTGKSLMSSHSTLMEDEDKFWRHVERVKTTCAALCVCLNIGVDPPDIVRPQQCARLECWIDPTDQQASANPSAILEQIGKQLQSQYERWQPRAKYKICLDPTIDDIKKVCVSLRRTAKDDRVLFHYNGHGVPKPTLNGEIWVFNRNFTQYIPLSLYDLQTWLGNPAILVYDCSRAGGVINSFNAFVEQRRRASFTQKESPTFHNDNTEFPFQTMDDCIQMAACGPEEILPLSPDLPADLFTACLTTPIDIALRWFMLNNPTTTYDVTIEMLSKLPGKLSDRRTPLGELNWIFTAITDTIAWNCFPNDIFQRLFRQDLLVASLFRNYLLAERIMKSYGCNPMTDPKLASTHDHPLWSAWDFTTDLCIRQLPKMLSDPTTFQFCGFFNEQLSAFEIWLDYGDYTKMPLQLPIVLQVLLSQSHRLRALYLLARYLDTGPSAIRHSLSVGIFPYVLKLLQSPALELRDILTFIWAKVLALDRGCQHNLLKDSNHKYFIHALGASSSCNDSRALAAFVLAAICHSCPAGQQACFKSGVLSLCYNLLKETYPLLLRHAALLLAGLCTDSSEIKQQANRDVAYTFLLDHLRHEKSDVRSSVIFALTSLLTGTTNLQSTSSFYVDGIIALKMTELSQDPCPMVRNEVTTGLILFASLYQEKFRAVSLDIWQEERARILESRTKDDPQLAAGQKLMSTGLFLAVWRVLLELSVDPQPEISSRASAYVDSVNEQFLRNCYQPYSTKSLEIFDWSCHYMTASTRQITDFAVKFPVGPEAAQNLKHYDTTKRRYMRISDRIQVNGLSFDSQLLSAELNSGPIHTILQHPVEPYVVIATDRGSIHVYHQDENICVQRFSTKFPPSVNLNKMEFVNPVYDPLLLTISNDSVVKIWSEFTRNNLYQVSSLRIFSPNSMKASSHLTTCWNQNIGVLAAVKAKGPLCLSDLSKAQVSSTIDIQSNSFPYHMATDGGYLYMVGFEDGCVRFFDSRLPNDRSIIITLYEHQSSISKLELQEGCENMLFTSSIEGEFRGWDLRMFRCIYSFNGTSGNRLTTWALHNQMPLIAAAVSDRIVRLMDFEGTIQSTIRFHQYSGNRIRQNLDPITALSFHPYLPQLAIGTDSSLFSLFSPSSATDLIHRFM